MNGTGLGVDLCHPEAPVPLHAAADHQPVARLHEGRRDIVAFVSGAVGESSAMRWRGSFSNLW